MGYFWHFWDSHWFTAIGLITALLGILYTSGNYLDKKYTSLKLMTHAFTFGILGAIISFLNDFLLTLIQGDFENYDSIAIPYGFGFGLAVFFVVYIFLNRFKQNNLLLIVIICVSLLINAFEINISNLYHYASFLSYFLAYISSFILGLFTASLRISQWEKTAFGFLIICLILVMLALLNVLQIKGIIDHEYLYIIGFIIGNITYKANQIQINSQINTWKSFIFWLLIGSIAQLVVLLPNFHYNTELALLFYALCASNAQGDKIIKQIKHRYKYIININRIQPLINWKRFMYSLFVAFLYILPLYFLYLLIIYQLSRYRITLHLIAISAGGIVFYSRILIVISLIYGFGKVIIYKIENLSEHRLGQIGVILTISGIFIATFNH